jgi:hypothetical protein
MGTRLCDVRCNRGESVTRPRSQEPSSIGGPALLTKPELAFAPSGVEQFMLGPKSGRVAIEEAGAWSKRPGHGVWIATPAMSNCEAAYRCLLLRGQICDSLSFFSNIAATNRRTLAMSHQKPTVATALFSVAAQKWIIKSLAAIAAQFREGAIPAAALPLNASAFSER